MLTRADPDGRLARAIGSDLKGTASVGLYLAGILAGLFVSPAAAMAFYVVVAIMWVIPDRRMERAVADAEAEHH